MEDKSMKKDTINITLVSSTDYLMICGIVISSAMKYAEVGREYRFYILTDCKDRGIKDKLTDNIAKKYDNCFIEYIDIGDILGDVKSNIPHITKATYYKVVIPNMIDVDKCLYLDCDIIVMSDLAKLYETDIENFDIAGVIAPFYHRMSLEEASDYCKKTGIPSMKQYINAGVMLLNLKALREKDFTKKALDLVDKDLPTMDQDIFNRLCYGRIKTMPLKYNYYVNCEREENVLKDGEWVIPKDEFYEAVRTPNIIHYAVATKPWEFFDTYRADKWWEACRETLFYDYFRERYAKSFYYYAISTQQSLYRMTCYSNEWYDELKRYKDVYIYGAGHEAEKALKRLLGHGIKITGILVSEMKEDSPKELFGVEVSEYSIEGTKDAIILLAVGYGGKAQIIRSLIGKGQMNFIALPGNEQARI